MSRRDVLGICSLDSPLVVSAKRAVFLPGTGEAPEAGLFSVPELQVGEPLCPEDRGKAAAVDLTRGGHLMSSGH